MEKKKYYVVDNGDTPVTCDWDSVIDLLEAETDSFDEEGNKNHEPQWTITLIWMTEEEYENLPEAY